jgi:hypothetical protein
MTRADAVTYVKHALFEDAASTGVATPAQINLTVDAANVAVWQAASVLQPSIFTETSADLNYVSATGYHDLAALSTVPSTLSLVHWKVGTTYYPIEELKSQEKDRLESYGVVAGGSTPLGYWMDGEKLKFLPSPTGNGTFRLTFVGRPTALSGDTDKLLLGKMVEWHLLVCFEAIMLLAAKDEAGDTFKLYKVLRDEMRARLDKWLTRRSTARPHFIREVAF